VKCDERPGTCLNCERLNLECQNADGTSATPTEPEDVRASQVSDSSLGEVGVKRKRTFRSCTQCRASKARCSGGRPKCARCVQRAVPCVYDEVSIPQWTRVVQSNRQSDVQTETSTSGSSNTKDRLEVTGSRQISVDTRDRSPPITISIEQPGQTATGPDLQPPTTGPYFPFRGSSSLGAFDADEGPDSLEWYAVGQYSSHSSAQTLTCAQALQGTTAKPAADSNAGQGVLRKHTPASLLCIHSSAFLHTAARRVFQ